MNKFYTGIGSRETPKETLNLMIEFAYRLSKNGYILRSGGTNGTDKAFERGCDKANGLKQIYIPWDGFNKYYHNNNDIILCQNTKIYNKSKLIIQDIHPNFNNLTKGALKLHIRNVFQVLGDKLNKKSKFIICWTPNAKLIGGTSIAIKIALKNNIKIYNLASKKDESELFLKLSNFSNK